jgi:hypothetical protein
MVRTGMVRPSDSPWSSALHLAPKGDTVWCQYGDYRTLNDRTMAVRVGRWGDLSRSGRFSRLWCDKNLGVGDGRLLGDSLKFDVVKTLAIWAIFFLFLKL